MLTRPGSLQQRSTEMSFTCFTSHKVARPGAATAASLQLVGVATATVCSLVCTHPKALRQHGMGTCSDASSRGQPLCSRGDDVHSVSESSGAKASCPHSPPPDASIGACQLANRDEVHKCKCAPHAWHSRQQFLILASMAERQVLVPPKVMATAEDRRG